MRIEFRTVRGDKIFRTGLQYIPSIGESVALHWDGQHTVKGEVENVLHTVVKDDPNVHHTVTVYVDIHSSRKE